MLRSGIAKRESPLLVSTTSLSLMMRKPSPICFAHRAVLGRAQARVRLRASNEEGLGIVDVFPPAEMIIAAVEHIGRTALDLHLTANLDVIDGCVRDLDATGNIRVGIIDDVHLHPADAAVPARPFAHLAQRDRAGV